jgi:enamine deaminase RidA (YjgF/YER057c/UK114 family)
MMQRDIINPWQWQDQLGFVQANAVREAQRVVYCAGQASVSAEGQPLHPGDLRAQTQQTFDNLETVLHAAGMSLAHVMRLTYYTTEVDGLLANWDVIVDRLTQAGARPASTLLGVTRLAFGLLIEIEATAVE